MCFCESMDCRLYDASLSGNTSSLRELLLEYKLLLDRILGANIPDTPLHIAALRGHVEVASLILQRRPETAQELNSQGLSSLHLASANGHVGIVNEILNVVPDSILARDRQGRTPLHAAAIKGRVEILKEIAHRRPQSVGDVTSFGETVLHLCAKHDQLEALKTMVGLIEDAEFVNHKDANGNTVLHIAAALKNFQMTLFLLQETRVEVNSRDKNGLTALDILLLALYPKELSGDIEMVEFLQQKGAKRAWELSRPTSEISEIASAGHIQFPQTCSPQEEKGRDNMSPQNNQGQEESRIVAALATLSEQIKEQWLQEMKQKRDDDKKNTMMVVAILIVTVTFQSTLMPPGGLWQDDPNNYNTTNINTPSKSGANHRAGMAILNETGPIYLVIFLFINKIAFFASLLLIASLSEINRKDAKETDSKVELAQWRRNALYLLALMSMELMYFASSIPIISTRATLLKVAATSGAAIILVFLLTSPWSLNLWIKLRCKGKKERESDDNGDISIET